MSRTTMHVAVCPEEQGALAVVAWSEKGLDDHNLPVITIAQLIVTAAALGGVKAPPSANR